MNIKLRDRYGLRQVALYIEHCRRRFSPMLVVDGEPYDIGTHACSLYQLGIVIGPVEIRRDRVSGYMVCLSHTECDGHEDTREVGDIVPFTVYRDEIKILELVDAFMMACNAMLN